jgi:hypothetical protein
MDRRSVITTLALVGVSALAGCASGEPSDGSNSNGDGGNDGGADGGSETVVSETVYQGDIRRYNFDVESGETIEVYINNIEGARTTVVLTDTNDESVETFEAETESTGTHEAEITGVYAVNITTLGEANVVVTL